MKRLWWKSSAPEIRKRWPSSPPPMKQVHVSTNQNISIDYSVSLDSDYGKSLMDDIKSETSGALMRLLVLTLEVKSKSAWIRFESHFIYRLCQGVRDEGTVDAEKAAEQAALLYGAGEAKLGTDEDAFVEVLSHAGQHQAYLIFEEYKKIAGRTMEQALKDEISGDLLKGLLAMGRPHWRAAVAPTLATSIDLTTKRYISLFFFYHFHICFTNISCSVSQFH